MSVRIKIYKNQVSRTINLIFVTAMFGHESRLKLKEIFVYYAE